MSYLDELVRLEPDDSEAALRLARKAWKAGELTRRNAEALVMLQTDPDKAAEVDRGLAEIMRGKRG
jgi:hypothetical protein